AQGSMICFAGSILTNDKKGNLQVPLLQKIQHTRHDNIKIWPALLPVWIPVRFQIRPLVIQIKRQACQGFVFAHADLVDDGRIASWAKPFPILRVAPKAYLKWQTNKSLTLAQVCIQKLYPTHAGSRLKSTVYQTLKQYPYGCRRHTVRLMARLA